MDDANSEPVTSIGSVSGDEFEDNFEWWYLLSKTHVRMTKMITEFIEPNTSLLDSLHTVHTVVVNI